MAPCRSSWTHLRRTMRSYLSFWKAHVSMPRWMIMRLWRQPTPLRTNRVELPVEWAPNRELCRPKALEVLKWRLKRTMTGFQQRLSAPFSESKRNVREVWLRSVSVRSSTNLTRSGGTSWGRRTMRSRSAWMRRSRTWGGRSSLSKLSIRESWWMRCQGQRRSLPLLTRNWMTRAVKAQASPRAEKATWIRMTFRTLSNLLRRSTSKRRSSRRRMMTWDPASQSSWTTGVRYLRLLNQSLSVNPMSPWTTLSRWWTTMRRNRFPNYPSIGRVASTE